MLKLAPSILAADISKLGQEILTIDKAGADYVHIDVMDGHFVPNITFGMPVIKSIRNTTNITFDVHLMIENCEKYIEDFANAGADIINVHYEAVKNLEATIRKIKSLNKIPAVTIKPDTPIESIYSILGEVSMILIMSVEPGFGGQKFMPIALDKSLQLANFISKNNLNVDIQMDGGITLENVNEVINAGTNIIVAGSSVFKGNSIETESAVKDFYSIFKKYDSVKNK